MSIPSTKLQGFENYGRNARNTVAPAVGGVAAGLGPAGSVGRAVESLGISTPPDKFGSSETSETLVSKDLQAKLKTAASQLTVRKLDIDSSRQQQADLALEISGKAMTGFEGAALTFIAHGKKAKAEVVTENGIRWELPVEPRSEFAPMGHIVGLPDGSKLEITPESPWNFGTSVERTNPEGSSLRARFANGEGTGTSLELGSLIASQDNLSKHVGLHSNQQGDMDLMVQANEYLAPGPGFGGSTTIRSAGEHGIGFPMRTEYAPSMLGMGMGMGFGDFGGEREPSLQVEPQQVTEAYLRDAAHQVEQKNPFLG